MSKKILIKRKYLEQIFEIVLDKYRRDPKIIEDLLPDLAQRFSLILPKSKSYVPSFGLTEKERNHHQIELRQIVRKIDEASINPVEAICGLEHSAVLIEDSNLPPEITYNHLVKLLGKALNISPGSARKSLTIPVKDVEISKNIPLVRGVILALTWDNQLVSVSIDLKKVKERRIAIRFIGIAKNDVPDVAGKHDYYFTESLIHA